MAVYRSKWTGNAYPVGFRRWIARGFMRRTKYPPVPAADVEQVAALAVLEALHLHGEVTADTWRRNYDRLMERLVRELGYRRVDVTRTKPRKREWWPEWRWYKRGLRPGAPYGNQNRKGKRKKQTATT